MNKGIVKRKKLQKLIEKYPAFVGALMEGMEFKFKATPKQSAQLQKLMFSLGLTWCTRDNNVTDTHAGLYAVDHTFGVDKLVLSYYTRIDPYRNLKLPEYIPKTDMFIGTNTGDRNE